MAMPSKQRALIALRSFYSVAAAARSMRYNPDGLRRMISKDPDLKAAHDKMSKVVTSDLVGFPGRATDGPIGFAAKEEKRAKKKAYLSGRSQASAAAIMHKRKNDSERRERFAKRKAGIDSVDAMMVGPTSDPQVATHDTPDRYCNNCETERCDDPCEVCCCHTVEVSDV